ncbi:hypothetical protein [Loigolactobacillus bifermentans]|uniref:Uncharacterized protein n=1 Tax=Loigolactobacillus bifermentans DSM 20003 TaxID=1423726 RepID=A0A0R1H6J4_9LACO|nr:hypothetical protein [Loigolactobacillus bifermentans]KRK39441.1 hypothetical protein FC07_GL002408 [Loigolactobacillus bifermentans DSM 20003]QGG61208.1 hypothetical protein LB003_12465 [Loigolactobacillus bifermentans]
MQDGFGDQRWLGRAEFGGWLILGLFGNLPLFVVSHALIATFLLVKTIWWPQWRPRLKLGLSSAYIIILTLQVVFETAVVFADDPWGHVLLRLVAASLVPVPFWVARWLTQTQAFEWPSLADLTTISLNTYQQNRARVAQVVTQTGHVRQVLSLPHLQALFMELHRHSLVQYHNAASLDQAYFERATAALGDPYLYIVISNTGSTASEVIGLFTQKQFNHASLSFDAALTTLLSYNGGERVYAPGLNPEMVQAFHQKADASVLVYRLSVTVAQKQKVLATVQAINATGSAYNILGLVTKHSLRRNMMFCSQFVYRMLQIGEVAYFQKQPGEVRPTDFVELDYRRQLEFVQEIQF